MKKILTGAVALCLALPPLAAQNTSSDVKQNNPFLQEYTTPYQIPPFSLIKNEHYLPALKEGISRHNAEIAAIAGNPEAPTFANTVLALDRAGALVERVVMVYAALSESNSSPELQAVAEEFEHLLAAHSDEV